MKTFMLMTGSGPLMILTSHLPAPRHDTNGTSLGAHA
jgi:hypothetical protein